MDAALRSRSSGVIAHCGAWDRAGYKSIQVNVDARGCNVLGDAANEPSIAVDPTNPRKIVIGWRQFNSVASDFREPGWGYSHDGGHTWVFRGSLDPGVFGSDPVLGWGPDGRAHYLTSNFDQTRLFRSADHGLTWGSTTQAFPSFHDKPWMLLDSESGAGYVYVCAAGSFARSKDSGTSFQWFEEIDGGLDVPTLTIDPLGKLLIANRWSEVLILQDPRNGQEPPNFVHVRVLLGGGIGTALSNPGGLAGQIWVAADHSHTPTRGNVYVLGSVDTSAPGPGLDVSFARSTDGGMTWSPKVRLNDDAYGNGAWHWFGMMSVAPNGRIDAVWNDTRNYLEAPFANLSELYYSFSTAAGETWSPNIPISPVFDSYVGWPENQRKIGDYYQMVSDNLGVNVAYAATFNGEQDIYFLRIGPWDCNGNEIDDAVDIGEARSGDCNANEVPDECEYRVDVNGDGPTTLSDFIAFRAALTGPSGPCATPMK